MRNVVNRANCDYNTKFRIIPRTTGAIPEKAASLCAAVRRNSNITTITIKSGGVGTMLSRRWRKRRGMEQREEGDVSYRRNVSRPNGENAGNKLSRSFLRAVTDLWFIARLRAGGSSGRQRNERTDVPSAIFPRTGANKVPAGGSLTPPPPFHSARYDR